MSRGQGERLMVLLEEVLAENEVTWADLDAIGVGIGPGNFTGIRISVSAARGLALGLDKPAIGVSLFETTMALSNWAQVTVPAPRDQVYFMDFDKQTAPVMTQAVHAGASSTEHSSSDHVAMIATLAAKRLASGHDIARPAPLYVKPADAAPPRARSGSAVSHAPPTRTWESFMTFTKILGATTALALVAGTAIADGHGATPAIIYDLGGKFDKSFNESAFNGAQRWAEENGAEFAEFEITADAQREQAIRRFAEDGNSPIVMAGFSWATALETAAPDYPDTDFVVIDVSWIDLPNVRAIGFKEQEGSYLVGMMAAASAEGGVVSFVGGMDIPLIRRFACGYAQGAAAANPDVTVIANMTGTTPAAWNDPVKGSELTLAQISQGSEVVFAAAGGTGVGVLQTAADEGILSIGVDANQNYLHPGQVLTSMLKRVDNVVYESFSGTTDAGIHVLGVESGAVGYAMDEFNAELVSDEMLSDGRRGRSRNGIWRADGSRLHV
ncbi:putative lipoprotein YufN [Nymphon striatum]|nr:putative lipoprotein YufN [Nymphon striatum]